MRLEQSRPDNSGHLLFVFIIIEFLDERQLAESK